MNFAFLSAREAGVPHFGVSDMAEVQTDPTRVNVQLLPPVTITVPHFTSILLVQPDGTPILSVLNQCDDICVNLIDDNIEM